MMNFTFYRDSGHGWLKVPFSLLVQMGIADQISKYSFMTGKSVYLEEDRDLSIFARAWSLKTGKPFDDFWKYYCQEKFSEHSHVRNYPRYDYEEASVFTVEEGRLLI